MSLKSWTERVESSSATDRLGASKGENAMTSVHEKLDRNLKRIKQGGIREVGEKLPYHVEEKPSREEVLAERKRKSRWYHAQRRKVGWE